jgi:hypothetical protein
MYNTDKIEDWDAYTIAPQFQEIATFAQELVKLECQEIIYFKRNKAYAAFKK